MGLAIAQRLTQKFPRKTTLLLERHRKAGEETSSRNSEVIHSGLYYPPDSLKTRLCLRGRDLLYERCRAYNIPHLRTGKLVVAKQDQLPYIEKLHAKSLKLQWPPHSPPSSSNDFVLSTELLSGEQAKAMEPNLSDDIIAALWCPQTGIIDSHSLMESLEKDILDSEGGELIYSTRVVRVDPYPRSARTIGTPDVDALEEGWVVQAVTGDGQGDAMLARTLINASGLSSTLILNALLREEDRIPMYYARGSYASYRGPGVSNVSHLIYPCPETGPSVHAFQSLGTHLTLDLQGKIRFGPDLQWISPPSGGLHSPSEEDVDFWNKELVPDESRLPEMHRTVVGYLPGVTLEGLSPDYVGLRPKLVPPNGGFQDFVFRTDYPTRGRLGSRTCPMISLLGIESPGLTCSLSIAEHVIEDLLESKVST